MRSVRLAPSYARAVFTVGTTAAILEAAFFPSLQGPARSLFGVGLLLVSVSLACASSCLAPSWALTPSRNVRRLWALGASVALLLGLILGGVAPLVSGR